MELTTKKIVHITKPQYITAYLTHWTEGRFYLSVNWAIIGSVCRLFSAKSLFEPKMVYGQLNYYEQKNSEQSSEKYLYILSQP